LASRTGTGFRTRVADQRAAAEGAGHGPFPPGRGRVIQLLFGVNGRHQHSWYVASQPADRDPGGAHKKGWPTALRRWIESYDVFKTNRSQTFVARQGPVNLMQRFTDDGDIAVTGSFAAVRLAPVAAPAMLVAYARDAETTATAFGLLPADRGANVVLLRPFDEVVWERTMVAEAICYVSPSQVAADCLTGNGRCRLRGRRW